MLSPATAPNAASRYARLAAIHRTNSFAVPSHPIGSTAYGEIIMAIGRSGREGNFHAHVASLLVRKVAPTLDAYQIMANVCDVLSSIAGDTWYDSLGAYGPETGRYSDHEHFSVDEHQERHLDLLLMEIEEVLSASGRGLGCVPNTATGVVKGYVFPLVWDRVQGDKARKIADQVKKETARFTRSAEDRIARVEAYNTLLADRLKAAGLKDRSDLHRYPYPSKNDI